MHATCMYRSCSHAPVSLRPSSATPSFHVLMAVRRVTGPVMGQIEAFMAGWTFSGEGSAQILSARVGEGAFVILLPIGLMCRELLAVWPGASPSGKCLVSAGHGDRQPPSGGWTGAGRERGERTSKQLALLCEEPHPPPTPAPARPWHVGAASDTWHRCHSTCQLPPACLRSP